MEVKPINPHEYSRSGLFAKDNFFGSHTWTDAVGENCRSFGVFSGNEPLAIFHLYRYSRLGKQFMINPPMAPHCGFRMVEQGGKTYTRQSEVKRALIAIAQFFKKEYKSTYFDFCFPPEVVDMQPFQWKSFHVQPRYTYVLNLNQSEDEMLRHMSAERRKNIKNSLEAGYEVLQDADSKSVMALVNSTLKKAGAPFKPELLESLLRKENDSTFSVLVRKEGKHLATAVCSLDRHSAYYLAGGHDGSTGDALAGSLALWCAITEAQLWGTSQFDFLGSSVPGVERFFRGFGAVLTPYFRVQTDPGIIGWLQKQKLKYTAKH